MALVRTRYGWQDDSLAASIDWGRPEAEMEAGRERSSRADREQAAQRSAEQVARMHGYASENVAGIQADAQRDAARIRAAAGYYNKGGPVIDVGYKHSNNPMYAKYGSTMDSSLLAKSRGRK